ncbi:MAG: hypothetical protein Q7I99_02650 [Acholeplasmataceae bacterium]|nr:hypothetical protein [Acholeplasmataceae bacterium]
MKYLIIILTVLLAASLYTLEVSKAYATHIEIYEIIFEDHDGKIIYREYVAAGADLSNFILPEVESKSGYLFMSWSAELPEEMPYWNLVIVAQYMRSELRVTATT